ncbi:short-chain dehydrogenase/reductase SDR [Caballeronia arvi]|uniref:Short-chain dehydrogenase/reductase SDR n=1 Tax=Caballeronia arvi TaxID=1777135 RepID=A0A158L5S4_9BURK|nr:short-chain dehydrogenase/reductase SDR [Caballeronia arvi]
MAIADAREGADVAIAYLDEHADAEDTARWAEKAGRRALLLPGDITDRAHCKELVEKTAPTFGRIDVLVNNAEVAPTGRIDEASLDDWRTIMSTDLDGVFYCSRAAIRHLIDAHWVDCQRIVCIETRRRLSDALL